MKDTSSSMNNMALGLSVTPTAASANGNMNRRPRAQSLQQHFGDTKAALAARDCCSSGSFVSKLFRMVDSEPSTIVSWIRGGTAFCIVDPKMMAEHCLPKYFRHHRFSSLIRQLNFYSFYRVQEGQLTIYQHSFFRKGRPDLLVHIKRRGAGKAKDPWFDPLANQQQQPSASLNNKNTSSNNTGNPSLNLSLIGANAPTMSSSNGMMCYSPMSKRVMMENMSPALKPGMAPNAAPPMVDLGGSMIGGQHSDDKMMASKQRWEAHKEQQEQSFSLSSAMQMKNELFYGDNLQSPMLKASEHAGLMPAPLDIDIQDFLTEDCSINAGMSDMKSQFEDRLCGSSMSSSMVPMHAKHALVSRDLLKWDTKCEDSHSSQVAGLLSSHDDNTTFEDELLLDLANVEPGAWEVPLSPLNEEEDMMPWLDLCF